MNAPAPRLDPASALYDEARSLIDAGRDSEASQRLDAAIRFRPDFGEAFALGAFLLERAGNGEAALRFYHRALSLQPRQLAAWNNLAKLHIKAGRWDEALACVDEALKLAPHDADALNTRSAALRPLWRVEEAAAAARAALKRRPDFAEAALNLGTAYLKGASPDLALAAYRRATALRPDYPDALCGAALSLTELGRLEEARACFDRAVALGCREAVSGRGCLDLMLGRFEPGWEGYEARWIDGKSIVDALGVRYPTWAGPAAPPQRVLVLNDHGLGDSIMFARYLPLMRAAGAEPHFLAPAKLHRLIGPLVEGRVSEREPEGAGFDAQIAISSLAHAFATRRDTIPAEVPYLKPEAYRIPKWAAEIGAGGLRIGCVWQGNANPEADIARSFPLKALAPLAAVPGVRLVSLQKGFGEEQIAGAGFPLQRLSPDLDEAGHAFLDTAAAMMSLDLIVTCDTSIAHLAGALGRPVWVALKQNAEWRWMRGRDDSPWYPTMRLFRQGRAGDWSGVFAAMAQALMASRISA